MEKAGDRRGGGAMAPSVHPEEGEGDTVGRKGGPGGSGSRGSDGGGEWGMEEVAAGARLAVAVGESWPPLGEAPHAVGVPRHVGPDLLPFGFSNPHTACRPWLPSSIQGAFICTVQCGTVSHVSKRLLSEGVLHRAKVHHIKVTSKMKEIEEPTRSSTL